MTSNIESKLNLHFSESFQKFAYMNKKEKKDKKVFYNLIVFYIQRVENLLD